MLGTEQDVDLAAGEQLERNGLSGLDASQFILDCLLFVDEMFDLR